MKLSLLFLRRPAEMAVQIQGGGVMLSSYRAARSTRVTASWGGWQGVKRDLEDGPGGRILLSKHHYLYKRNVLNCNR